MISQDNSSTYLHKADIEERVNLLLSRMTLDEKIGQMNQVQAWTIGL